MIYFMSFSALVIFSLQHNAHAKDFTLTRENVIALQKLEERLLPALDEFITDKEEHLKELESTISQTETVKTLSSETVERYLGTPVNQYFTIKRFIHDWGTLTELLDSDSSNKDLLSQIWKEENEFPAQAELNKALRDLQKTSAIDPEGYRVLL